MFDVLKFYAGNRPFYFMNMVRKGRSRMDPTHCLSS